MPLPPLPDNNTARLFVDYTTGRNAHTLICRYDQQNDLAVPIGAVLQFLTALQPVLNLLWAVTGVRNQAAGSIVTLPVDPLGLDGFQGGSQSSLDLSKEPLQYVWTGRGEQTGRQVRVGVYGIQAEPPATYRWTGAGRPAWAADAAESLRLTRNLAFITIGEDSAVWRDYVNANYNSYWETEARNG